MGIYASLLSSVVDHTDDQQRTVVVQDLRTWSTHIRFKDGTERRISSQIVDAGIPVEFYLENVFWTDVWPKYAPDKRIIRNGESVDSVYEAQSVKHPMTVCRTANDAYPELDRVAPLCCCKIGCGVRLTDETGALVTGQPWFYHFDLNNGEGINACKKHGPFMEVKELVRVD